MARYQGPSLDDDICNSISLFSFKISLYKNIINSY